MDAPKSQFHVGPVARSWFRFLWAIAISTAVALLAFGFFTFWLTGRSAAIPFLLAPLVAASLGGWRAGASATVVVAALFASLALPPIGDPRVYAGADQIQLMLLLGAGLALSALIEALHRARAREGQQLQAARRVRDEVDHLDRRFEQALETGRMIAWDWDLASDRISRSGTAVTFFGLSSDKPADLFELVHPEDRGALEAAVEQAISTESGYQLHYRVRTPDGSFRWLEDRGRFERAANGRRRLFGAVVDVTDRKREEVIARVSTARFHAFMANTPVAAYIKDAKGRYLFVNRRVEQQTQRPLADWIGKRDEDLFDASIASTYQQNDRRVIESGEGMAFDETFQRADGEHHFRSFKFRLEDESGEPLLGGISLDVTDQMRASAALRASEDQLREQDRRKDVFLAMLAHELRNPLAPLRNALEAMLRLPRDGDAWMKSHAIMDRQLTHATRLLDDLLDVSRITQGKLSLDRHRMALAASLDMAIESKRPMIAAAGQTLDIVGDAAQILVDGDRFRLAQVFANLIDNASKYSPAGSRLVVSVQTVGFQAEVLVRDFGSGIAEAQVPLLFELFWQATGSGVDASRGLGIGLTLVRSLVELHGGTITVTSEGPGKGSTFTLRFPLAVVPDDTAAPASKAASSMVMTPSRVLVADDNLDAADSLAMLLRAEGHEVVVAYDGAAALRAAEAAMPDAAILDLGMPLVDGYEVCRRLRENPAGRGMLIVALSGWGQPEDRRRSEAAGFNSHFLKPAQPQALIDTLAHLRDLHSACLVPISTTHIEIASPDAGASQRADASHKTLDAAPLVTTGKFPRE